MRINQYFLIVLAIFTDLSATHAQGSAVIPGVDIARMYPVISNKPSPGFFEGALLGNGGMGVNVTTRPDAVVLYFGHNNVWDIRLEEKHKEEIGTFAEVFEKVNKIPDTLSSLNQDPWYSKYLSIAGDNYNKSYPRPFPCGSVVLRFDRRKVQLLGHHLDISNGLCTIRLLTQDKKELLLEIFADMLSDRLVMQLVDKNKRPAPNIFTHIRIIPDPSTPGDIPQYKAEENLETSSLSFRQVLPSAAPGTPQAGQMNAKDRAFRLTAKLSNQLTKSSLLNWHGSRGAMATLEAALFPGAPFNAMVVLQEGLNAVVPEVAGVMVKPDSKQFNTIFKSSVAVWNAYWSQSAVKLEDRFLEETWYRNLYFFNCAAKDNVTCPGLFANWSYNNIGTAWHGDYHMNYNTQQPFWVSFSSNHLEKNLPYVNLVHHLMPVARKWAKDYYGLPGAYFPHSAYPVEMSMNPYPLPDWGWEVSETPWTVQGLWWHYIYSGDIKFLRSEAYDPIKAACEFLTAYMKRPDAHGGSRWKDDKYHIFPTVPPELFALQPGFRYNYDCGVDLSLTRFIFNAFTQAADVLGTKETDKQLLADISEILHHFPDYPASLTEDKIKVLVTVPGEGPNTVYNVPVPLFSVFPGEDHGLHSDAATLQLLKDTYRNQRNEGGNDLVFINMQAARIGMLDMEDFKRHIRYCLLPNGTATNMVTQVNGRYNDLTDYSYMAGMGIWFENFALPAVINECLMQGYNGTIRLFPNWPADKDAAFQDLRAAGAFLVSASQHNGKVTAVSIKSEKGGTLRLISPWGKSGRIHRSNGIFPVTDAHVTIITKPGEIIRFSP
jgi:alpha-L-fucosidase 2